MASESDALREAYASAPGRRMTIATIELRNETFDAPVRVVADDRSWDLPLEADAPVDGGQTVTFTALAFDFEEPASNKDAPGAMRLRLDNVSKTMGEILSRPQATQYPVLATMRFYVINLASDPPAPVSAGPDGIRPRFEVANVVIRDRTAVGTCRAPDFGNIKASILRYTRKRSPGLVS